MAILVIAILLSVAQGRNGPVTETEIKAAFIYNFAKFVSWPQTSFSGDRSPIRICVTGSDPVASTLQEMTLGKTAQGRSIEVQAVFSPESSKSCHILFISAADENQFRDFFKSVAGESILTVGDADGFAENGGIIGFYIQNQKLRFAINLAVAQRTQLKISSKLLGIAKVIGAP